MSDVTESGRRLVTRTVLLQAAGSLLVAALFLLAGLAQARAALTGGMIVTIGTAILGRRMFAAGVVPGEVLVAGSLLGTALRWLWLVGAMWCALALLHVPALPLVCGLAAAYVAFGLATVRNK